MTVRSRERASSPEMGQRVLRILPSSRVTDWRRPARSTVLRGTASCLREGFSSTNRSKRQTLPALVEPHVSAILPFPKHLLGAQTNVLHQQRSNQTSDQAFLFSASDQAPSALPLLPPGDGWPSFAYDHLILRKLTLSVSTGRSLELPETLVLVRMQSSNVIV